MYSKEQIGHSDFILKTIAEKGGRMEKSDLAGLLDDKYGYTVEPHLQLEQLIVTEGMIERQNAWLFLTKKGQEAARRGFANHLRRQDWLDRVRENKDIVSMAAGIGTIIGVVLTVLAQCT